MCEVNTATRQELMDLHKHLTKIEDAAEKYRSAYMWSDRGYDYGIEPVRQARSERDSVPEVTWTDGGKQYTAEYRVSYTRTQCWPKGIYTKDGQKTTLTAVKSSHKRIITRLQEMGAMGSPRTADDDCNELPLS